MSMTASAKFVQSSPRGFRLRQILSKGAMYVLLSAVALTFLFPILWAISSSLKSLGDVYQFPPTLWADEWLWSNYPDALKKLPFLNFMVNTVVICLSATTGQVLSCSLVGFAFARLQWRGQSFWFVVLLATMMLPGQVLLIPRYILFDALGWINTYKPLIVPYWFGESAFFIFLFRQFFKAIPKSLEEAAVLDGATTWQIYWHIFLPNAKPVIATVAVMSLIQHWKDFMNPLIYINDMDKFPISVGLDLYNSLEGSWINLLMAASLTALAPLVVLFFLAQRYFVQGLLLSGTKG